MFDKYLVFKDKTIIAKQTSSGRWICDQLPAETTKELETLIGEVNRILNKYNVVDESKPVRVKADVGGVREMKQL